MWWRRLRMLWHNVLLTLTLHWLDRLLANTALSKMIMPLVLKECAVSAKIYCTLQLFNIQETAGVDKCIYFFFFYWPLTFHLHTYWEIDLKKNKPASYCRLLFRLKWESAPPYMLIKSASTTRVTIIFIYLLWTSPQVQDIIVNRNGNLLSPTMHEK